MTTTTSTTDPMIARVSPADDIPDYRVQEIDDESRAHSRYEIPTRYRDATVTMPEVRDWIVGLVHWAQNNVRAGHPAIREGESLILAGPAGRGKSWQAWGAMRALSVCGAHCRWKFLTAEDMFAQLRPRHGVDTETVFEGIATAEVLVIDDLGATKDTGWTETTLTRVIDHRSKWVRPTLITTNIAPPDFTDKFGSRVSSRLTEMARVVPFTGPDLRRAGGAR